ncbi:MAG: hypothetical protein ACJASC_002106 [Limimaricola cinnabarinus]|jgi:hypothetical protein|uniref:hypothetical protein n=1 Tax=Limimaricola cinnabarinus TaxID=1125964 RepID=UPI0039E311EB
MKRFGLQPQASPRQGHRHHGSGHNGLVCASSERLNGIKGNDGGTSLKGIDNLDGAGRAAKVLIGSTLLKALFLAFTYIVGVEIRIVHFSGKRFFRSTRWKHLLIGTVREAPDPSAAPLCGADLGPYPLCCSVKTPVIHIFTLLSTRKSRRRAKSG